MLIQQETFEGENFERFCGYLWKFSPRNLRAWHLFAAWANNLQKFSPQNFYFPLIDFTKFFSLESFLLSLKQADFTRLPTQPCILSNARLSLSHTNLKVVAIFIPSDLSTGKQQYSCLLKGWNLTAIYLIKEMDELSSLNTKGEYLPTQTQDEQQPVRTKANPLGLHQKRKKAL